MACLADVFSGAARWCVEPCDALYGLSCMPSNSADSMVTDPPAGIAFMGKTWDSDKGGRQQWIAWLSAIMSEAFRVMKPGAHALVWALPRTAHWTMTALEDAGFEVRDVVVHLFATGFPKSANVSKLIDARNGDERPVIGRAIGAASANTNSLGEFAPEYDATSAASAASAAWDGWGTALKPAAEHWILCRKPLGGTIADCVLKHGTGALNIDGCRIEGAPEGDPLRITGCDGGNFNMSLRLDNPERIPSIVRMHGRWPSNVTLDEGAAELLDEQSGDRPGMSGGGAGRTDLSMFGVGGVTQPETIRGDNGGASRFFFTSKASRAEKDAGLDDFEASTAGEATGRKDGTDGLSSPRAGAGRTGGAKNTHPTPKRVDLMRYLTRLVTPPKGLVLDPFCGSGSGGVAAMHEGMRFVGLELEPLHVDFARARIAHVIGGTWERETKQERVVEKRQPSLFDALGGGK